MKVRVGSTPVCRTSAVRTPARHSTLLAALNHAPLVQLELSWLSALCGALVGVRSPHVVIQSASECPLLLAHTWKRSAQREQVNAVYIAHWQNAAGWMETFT